ncbi:hypothetical protein AUC43_11170 [Hymenobacter sedentarius]|uniref:Secretion system C-terminal sorting domain-containing protein n=1 Tax=Hymenobacter sedentarius TaxID=1411621 RepID=A0A0U4C3I0_9BACT|nr:T9SS type A sorting domain-containing protein [Hymenobacter sedentarius]ALW85602.1 hypothetical protein AUC43_11170 [Hymenobacter sedentarius]
MNSPLQTHQPLATWPRLLVLLWLMVAGLLPGRTQAQTTGPSGGTLSPAASSVCAGFNSGTLTLTGYTGSIIKYQADSGNGYVDITANSPTYTFSNLQTTTNFRAIVQNGTSPAVASTVATVTVGQPPTATINSQGPTTFCQQGTIYLVAGPIAAGNKYQFLLNGREIVGATSATYTALVTANSSYSVEVTNATGCSSISASVTVLVLKQNVVNLTAATPTTFCQGGSVLLSANTSGQGASGYTFQYEKDGVQIPGATNATYTATTSGAYRVVAYNPATCTSTSNTINVTATPLPTVSFSYALPSYCQSGPTNPTPTASPSGGTFTASPTGLSLNPTTGIINLSQSQPGTYAVAYGIGGTCPASASVSFTITAAPTADFSYAGGSRCAGTQGTITPTLAAGATAGTYTASPAGLSLNASTGAVDVAQSQPGTYTITNSLAAASGCSATSASTSLVLNAQPTPALAAGGATTFCQGGSVTLTATGGTGAATYQFYSNGQPISGATGTSYAATASGSYTVLITNPGGCAATSAPVSVTVNPLTTASFGYASASVCQSSGAAAATITGTTGGTFAASPAGLGLNATTGTITPGSSTPGTYTITYAVGGPCPSSSTQTVTITAPAAATFSYPATAYCASSSIAPTLASGASAGTFSSTTGLGLNTSTGAIDLSQSQPGTYTITNTVAASGGCAATSATATLTVNALPAQPTLTLANGVLSTATVAGATYQYYLNGVAIAGATSATYTTTQGGAYTVVVSTNGCASAPSAAVTVTVTAARSGQSAFGLAVFPNPTTGSLTVSIAGSHSAAQLTVYNALGQRVLTSSLAAAATARELDLSSLPTGVYVLRAVSTEGTVTQRIVRQ